MFAWVSLSKLERRVFRVLYRDGAAMNAMQIYYAIAIPYLEENGVLRGEEIYTKTRLELEALLNRLRKNNAIPARTTISRTIDFLVELGWIGKRNEVPGKASALYYLREDIASAVKKHTPDKFPSKQELTEL